MLTDRASGRLAVWPSVLLLAGCARIAAPPGGPPDQSAPLLIATQPDSIGVYPDWDEDVEFRFDEVVSEGSSPNFGLGTGDLERLVIVSPTTAVPHVRWRRSRITVRPREGWRPNTVYRVELLPGLVDLRNNRSRNGRVITFTTGAPIPTDTLRGEVINWDNRLPAGRALVEARLLPDSLPYRTTTDSLGRFVLGPLPSGEYLVHGALDQNNDARRQDREPFDSVRVRPGEKTVGELWAFRHDTTAIRITTVAKHDSLALALTLSQQLDPRQVLSPDSVRVVLLPDSTVVPVDTLLPGPVYDSVFGRAAARDTLARAADSARVQRERARADSIRADSIARAQAFRIPGAARRRPPAPVDTAGRGPRISRPPLFDRVVVRLEQPLRPGGRYVVTLRGIRSLTGVAASPRSAAFTVEQQRADTGKAVRDTTRRDTTAAPPRPGLLP
ncbi:MAG: Ig-like domain-containing protein [Gemmatimonadales bacterium]